MRGCLYDLGPYPALCAGNDWVQGERWAFSPDSPRDIATTLSKLDAIEGYQQPRGDDLYRREVVDCYDLDDDTPQQAYTYFFARPKSLVNAPLPVRRIEPNEQRTVVWTPRPGQRYLDE